MGSVDFLKIVVIIKYEEFFEKVVEPAFNFMKQEIESKYNKGVKIHISPTGIATSGKGREFASLTIYSEAFSKESENVHPLARTIPDKEFREKWDKIYGETI